MTADGGRLDPSSTTEADRDLLSVHDHRHFTAPLRQLEHALELLAVLLHIEVLEVNLAPGVFLTGRLRVGSGIFAEDDDHQAMIHVCIPCETVHIIHMGFSTVVVVRFAPLALVAWTGLSSHAAPLRLSAQDIARRVQDRDTGRDSRSTMRMKLFDRHGRARERALTMVGMRGRGTTGAGPSAPDGDRLLLRFTYPNDIRGTAFLVWEHPDSDDERFLYLPSLGRVRRIAGTETQESFVGTDFTYEDISGRELDEYTYAILEENASWTPRAGGAARAAWRLESRRKDASVRFPRVVSLVIKDAFIVVQADIYNRRNEKQKTYTVKALEQVERIWTAIASEMTNAKEKTRTELTIESMDYNVGLNESDFTRRELERGIK